MQRDPRAYLWDVRESALAIQAFTAGMDVSGYATNAMAQALRRTNARRNLQTSLSLWRAEHGTNSGTGMTISPKTIGFNEDTYLPA